MSKFQQRLESKLRINGLEKVIIKEIEDFGDANPELSRTEVNAVLLKLLTHNNDNVLNKG